MLDSGKGFLPFCEPRTAKIAARGDDWSSLDQDDEKLAIPITKILRLRAAGLTMEMVAFDFIRMQIAPLQHRGGGWHWRILMRWT